MIGKTPHVYQMTFLEVALESFIDMNHGLVQLSKAIDWAEVESEFSGYYCSDNGRPGVPIRKRACIEPVIGHLKSYHRMIRNYLRGTLGDAVDTLLAAAAYNLRHWMNKLPHTSFVSCLLTLANWLENLLFENHQQHPRLRPVLAMAAK